MDYRRVNLIEYMNNNVASLALATLKAQHGLVADNIEVVSVEIDGYYVRSNGIDYFLTFEKPCNTFYELRNELLMQLRIYRKFLEN